MPKILSNKFLQPPRNDLNINNNIVIQLRINNESIINLATNPIFHGKNKYITIKFYYLRDQVSKDKLIVESYSTMKQLANLFTKLLRGSISKDYKRN